MVGHYHERVKRYVQPNNGYLQPLRLNDLAAFTELHLPIYHLAKQAFSLSSTDGNEIDTLLTIIVSRQSD